MFAEDAIRADVDMPQRPQSPTALGSDSIHGLSSLIGLVVDGVQTAVDDGLVGAPTWCPRVRKAETRSLLLKRLSIISGRLEVRGHTVRMRVELPYTI
jgi:hypothetical protein